MEKARDFHMEVLKFYCNMYHFCPHSMYHTQLLVFRPSHNGSFFIVIALGNKDQAIWHLITPFYDNLFVHNLFAGSDTA